MRAFCNTALLFVCVCVSSLFEVPHSRRLVDLQSSFRSADTTVSLIWSGDNTEKPFSLIAALWTATPTLSTSYTAKVRKATPPPEKKKKQSCLECTRNFFCILFIFQLGIKAWNKWFWVGFSFFFVTFWLALVQRRQVKEKKGAAIKIKTGQEGFLGGKLAVSNGREDEVAFDEKRGGTKFR